MASSKTAFYIANVEDPILAPEANSWSRRSPGRLHLLRVLSIPINCGVLTTAIRDSTRTRQVQANTAATSAPRKSNRGSAGARNVTTCRRRSACSRDDREVDMSF